MGLSNENYLFKVNNSGIRKYLPLLSVIVLSAFTPGCHQVETEPYKSGIDSIGITLVPDLREGIFDVSLVSNGSEIVLKGETDVPLAKESISGFLKSKGVIYKDSLILLPDPAKIKEPWGLVNVSVCNIRLFRSYDAEMVSQALMGTPVRILKKDGGWYLVQTPDKYLGWVDNEAIETKTENEYILWKSSPRLFYTKKTGDIYASRNPDTLISDIVAGCIVEAAGEVNEMFEVMLPDGRKGFIPNENAIPLSSLSTETFLKPENLVTIAESFMGIPYLWGGTSSKGFDCSGFVKIVYYLNGIILSRDASQQYQYGLRIRRSFYPDSLKAGDLLFFGSQGNGRPRPTHVGMYLGDSEFIHASGMVKINSLDSTRTNFSRFRRDSFIGIRRILGAKSGKGLQPVLDHSWYK
jgi:hypothetical protein